MIKLLWGLEITEELFTIHCLNWSFQELGKNNSYSDWHNWLVYYYGQRIIWYTCSVQFNHWKWWFLS